MIKVDHPRYIKSCIATSSLPKASELFRVYRPWQLCLKIALFPAQVMNIHEAGFSCYVCGDLRSVNSLVQVVRDVTGPIVEISGSVPLERSL